MACRWEYLNKKKQFNDLLFFLEKRNIKALLFTQPPVLNFMEDKNASQYFTYLGLHPKDGFNLIEVNNFNVKKSNEYIRSLVSKYTNVIIYDVYENMILDNKTKVSFKNDVLYFDDDHLSYNGTLIHKQYIASLFNSILKKQ